MEFGIGLTIGKLTLAKQVTFTHRVLENSVFSHLPLINLFIYSICILDFKIKINHLIYIYIQICIAIRKLDFRIRIIYLQLGN